MDSVNLRDPSTASSRIYVGHLNESVSQELLEIKFSPYGKITGFLRTSPGFCFIQYDQPGSATNAIQCEDGSSMGGLKILVKTAEMKSQKRSLPQNEMQDIAPDQPMNKKYFSEGNEYYGNNSIMVDNPDSDINHCEIVVVSKHLTSYAEAVENQLKMLGIRVDLLFPNDSVPINKVLGNIQSRGCLYAILILQDHLDKNSLTLTILYGDPTEHRNMPTEDAIKFLYKDFCNKTKKLSQNVYQHPDAVQTLLKTLADNRSLTVLQYEHIIQYLSKRKEVQRRAEIGEDAEEVDYTEPMTTSYRSAYPSQQITATVTSQVQLPVERSNDLQKKIMDILNKKSLMPVAKKIDNSKPLTEEEKDALKSKLLKDEKIKLAMQTLRERMKK